MPDGMNPLQAAKSQLRKDVKRSLKALSAAEVATQSSKIHERLFALPEYQNARSISVYLSMPSGEVATESIVSHALKNGKQVFVPYIYKNQSTTPRSLIDMVGLRSEDDFTSMKRDSWGIPAPDAATIEERARCLCLRFGDDGPERDSGSLSKLDLIVMPGVAFDRERRRLGHGKGFYDIFLSQYCERLGSDSEQVKVPYLVGLALAQQLLPTGHGVPVDASDWLLDSLLSGDHSLP